MKKLFSIILCGFLGFFIGSTMYLLLNQNLIHVSAPTINDSCDGNHPLPTPEATLDNINISPYTGEPLTKEEENNIPFLCIIENSIPARPQSGLSEADILYETMAEGGIPRFLALFHKNSPTVIGPVRSVRPYFIDISREYALPFAHCGGSAEALATITSDNTIESINEISQDKYFWREYSRKAPHNLYTSAIKVRDFINSNEYTITPKSSLKFNKLVWYDENLGEANGINLNLSSYYSTSYKYKNGTYEKYMDGNLATDLNTSLPLSFSNVVVQITDINIQNDNLHLSIDLVGEGEGYVFSNGKVQKITWYRPTLNTPTQIKTTEGETLPLSPGNTIWHIVDTSTNISFE